MVKYYFRIDDVYEFMNLENFQKTINLFEKYDIELLLSVTPDWKLISFKGYDFIFENDLDEKSFFKYVKKLEKKHIIGLHGHQHTILTNNKTGLIKLNNFGEFAGLDYDLQKNKIKASLDIFKNNNLKTNIFIAPAHSFDSNTLKILKSFKFKFISDGLFVFPEKRENLFFLPQIFGKPRELPFGEHTFAIHPNFMKEKDFKNLENFIKKNRRNIYNFSDLLKKSKSSAFNSLINFSVEKILRIYKLVNR